MIDKEIQDRITKYDLLFESRLSKTEATLVQLEKNFDECVKMLEKFYTDYPHIRELKDII